MRKPSRPLDPMHHNSLLPVEYISNSIEHILCHFRMIPELSCSCCNSRVHARFHNNTRIERGCNSDIGPTQSRGCYLLQMKRLITNKEVIRIKIYYSIQPITGASRPLSSWAAHNRGYWDIGAHAWPEIEDMNI